MRLVQRQVYSTMNLEKQSVSAIRMEAVLFMNTKKVED